MSNVNGQFICKEGSSNWYLRDESGGSFLTPPGHATRKYSIVERRDGHDCGFYSLEGIVKESWAPCDVKQMARHLLHKYPGDVKNETWIRAVYTHMRHCYKSPDGKEFTFGKFWGNADEEKNMDPTWHLAYQYVKRYDASHTPRVDLF